MSLPRLERLVVAVCMRRVRQILYSRHKSVDRRYMEACDAIVRALGDMPTGKLLPGATLAEMGFKDGDCHTLSELNLDTVEAILEAGYGELETKVNRTFSDRIRHALATFEVHLTRDGSRPARNS